jgi:glycosyltransferase involved in cell wall biosynthesis
MKRLAIITSHPIQYNAPWLRLLAETEQHVCKVFYTWSQGEGEKYDPGFKRNLEWDIPLLEGYNYEFVENISKDPGTHHFSGIDNPTLIKTIATWKPDAILVIGWSFKSHLKCMRHYHGKLPVIFRGDSTLLDEKPGLKKVIRRIFLRWVYRNADYALVVGKHNRAYFLAHGMKDEQLIQAPHAIDNDRFFEPNNQYLARARKWRNDLGIADDDFVIMYAGKFEAKKNPLFILELAKVLTAASYKFMLVGNGELEDDIRRGASADTRIMILGFQNQTDMPVVYRMANLFVLPSVGPGETWGLALNEAMASGIPVMANVKVGGAVDLIEQHVNGFIFDHENPAPAFAFIEKLHDDAAYYKDVSAAAKEKVKLFSFNGIVEGITGLLNTISSKRY